MAIDKETNKLAGVGGFNAESSDNSITIEDAGKDTKDFKVNWDEMPLVTEDENGKARAFDKLVNDHSLHNVAYMRHGETAEDNETTLTDTDSMYTPKTGQMLNWIDGQGKQHISRFVKMEDFNPLPKKLPWQRSTYDEVHGTFIVLAGAHEESSGNGFLTVAVRSFYNKWDLIETNNYNEAWKDICAGGGYVVALSGNRSREYCVSNDGGYTWEQRVLPNELYWTHVKYMCGKFYFFARSLNVSGTDYWGKIVSTEDFNVFVTERQGDASGFTVDMFVDDEGHEIEVVQKPSRMFYLKNALTEILLCTLAADDNLITGIQVVGNKSIVYSGEGGGQTYFNTLIRIDNSWSNSPTITRTERTQSEWNTYLLREYAGELAIFNVKIKSDGIGFYGAIFTVKKFDSPWNTIKQIFPPNPYYSIMRGFAVCGDYALLAAGNFYYGAIFVNGDGARLINLKEFEFVSPFEYWEELPQVPEDSKGLLCCENKVVKNATVEEPYLQYRDKTVKANASDRITEYANYRLTRGDSEIWCIVENSDIVDNTTKVYANEDCTEEIGVILNHNYNINNPNDTEVLINGETLVYEFIDSKIPQSLATTGAIIAAIEAAKKKVPVAETIWYIHNGVPTKVQNITYNSNTGFFEKTISNNVNDQIVAVIDDQYPAVDYSNMLILYTCVQVSGTFTTHIACMYTDGTRTAPLIMTV